MTFSSKPLPAASPLSASRLAPLLLAVLLAGCAPRDKPVAPLAQSRELVVVTHFSSTTFYRDAEGKYAGLEYDLVKMFADELGVRLKFIVVPQLNQIRPMLARRRAHFAAAGLSVAPEWQTAIEFGPPYQTVQQQVVYHADAPRPESLQDLAGKKIEIVAGAGDKEELREAQKKIPGLIWSEAAAQGNGALLEKVADKTVDYAIADEHVIDLARNFYPDLSKAFAVGKPRSLAWAFPRDADPDLLQKARAFFDKIARTGALKAALDRYYGHIKRLDQSDVRNFLEEMRTVLPRFRKYFYEAQELTGIDWRLLAALGFQESHWEPLATSPTGVRGLMMLTEETADRMKVSDRLDAHQNILAGASYLLTLKETLPARIREPDKTWMAIAAYNVGHGHLEDARILAQRHKLNPDSWADLKKTLPLLAKSDYFTTVKRGFARGGEPVIMTENIRTYYDILAKFEPPYKPAFPSVNFKITVTQEEP